VVGEPLRERLRSLEGREVAGVVAVAALVVGGAVLWYVRSLPSPVHVTEVAAARPAPSVSPSPSASPATLVVHVAGWVRRPGVYELPAGARVVDAIRRAGGARKGADLASINLAALLSDATQVLVPRRGQSPGPPAGPGGAPGAGGLPAGGSGGLTPAGGAGGTPAGGAGGTPALVNLNTATLEELEALPGIGPTLAQRIIDHRTRYGPFRTVEDLLDVSGIGEQRLADIRALVTV
jgi:competence protein ComEA